MEVPPETNNRNPRTVKLNRNSNTDGKNNEFEFCKVCKLNHNQGRRHKYLPNHVKSLSSFLSRFHSKLSDVLLFLKNPSFLRPELASRNRFWCVFCDCDVTEHCSSFACEKAISHLASADHLKNLKSFLWKNGGVMDRVDRFRVPEVDLAKYEKKCISMKNEGGSEQSRELLIGPSNHIHNELKHDYLDNFDRNLTNSHNSAFTNDVLPLQNHTNENYQVPISDDYKSLLLASDANNSNNLRGSEGRNSLKEGYLHNVPVNTGKKEANWEGNSAGLQNLTQISIHKVDAGNVHSGAPPPWLNTSNEIHHKPVKIKSKKSKLNPNRVGAAWADRRKIEMEMERKGKSPIHTFDSNWLPNFGSVWQSGTRKDSRKEFKVEIGKSTENEDRSVSSMVQLQPYVSKRMRREANE